VELDLKSSEGKEILYELAAEADVFVENFRPGTAAKLGVDYETIKEYNDSIIYCSISAFGETGPWSDRPGYDLLAQGMGGLMDVTGYPDGDPQKWASRRRTLLPRCGPPSVSSVASSVGS